MPCADVRTVSSSAVVGPLGAGVAITGSSPPSNGSEVDDGVDDRVGVPVAPLLRVAVAEGAVAEGEGSSLSSPHATAARMNAAAAQTAVMRNVITKTGLYMTSS